jgi:hypothetical protein
MREESTCKPRVKPCIVCGTGTERVRVERTPAGVTIFAPLAAGLTARQTIAEAEPLLTSAELELFRQAFEV